jgi:hypothetical protein
MPERGFAIFGTQAGLIRIKTAADKAILQIYNRIRPYIPKLNAARTGIPSDLLNPFIIHHIK